MRASRVERHEVQVRAHDPERFGLMARRLLDHHKPSGPSKALRRPGHAAEEWQTTQAGGDLLGRANPRLERFAEEREPEAEHEADDEAERPVPDRLRLGQDRPVGLPQDRRGGWLERLHRLERLLAVDQARVERPVRRERSEPGARATALERRTRTVEPLEALIDIRDRALDRVRVELLAVIAVRLRVGVRELLRERRVGIRDRKSEDVRGRRGRDARVGEEIGDGQAAFR